MKPEPPNYKKAQCCHNCKNFKDDGDGWGDCDLYEGEGPEFYNGAVHGTNVCVVFFDRELSGGHEMDSVK